MIQRPVIVGGGLAGISTGLRLAEAGLEPIVLETRKKLGGRATSFVDPRSGQELDNCQHVLLGCCTNLLDLYDRLGVLDQIEWHGTLYWTAGGGIVDVMRSSRLPAPLHLTGSFRRLSFLNGKDKRAIARAMWRMIRMGAKGRLAWQDRTFAELLDSLNQPTSAVQKFWETIIVSACNLPIDRVAAVHALQVFQDGFLANGFAYTMGLASVPLRQLYEPVLERIVEAGGEVRLGVSVKSIAFDGKRVTGVVTDDGFVSASHVVSTVPPDRLEKLVSTTLRQRDTRLARLGDMAYSPILGVHLWFDQPVLEHPHMVFVGSGVHWLFNKGRDEDGRFHVHAVISAADAWMSLDEEAIGDRVMREIHTLLPGSRGIMPSGVRTVKEKRATFAATPEIEQIRPSAAPTSIGLGGGSPPNLFLAGDWCDTGWPATMEGAVRSGYAAAGGVLGRDCMVGDLPPGLLARLLGLAPADRTAD